MHNTVMTENEARQQNRILSGVAVGAMVMTMEGEMPVEFLGIGDRVLTRGGARKIRAITVMVANNSEVVVINQQSLGHDRPSQDTTLPAMQAILIRDWRAKALFDAETAMVPASRLADGTYIRRDTVSGMRFFALGFDRDEVIYVDGLELACQPQQAFAEV